MSLDHEFAHSSGRGEKRYILPGNNDFSLRTDISERPVLVRCALCDWAQNTTEGRMASIQRAHFHQHHSPGVA